MVLSQKLFLNRTNLTDNERIELYIDGYHNHFKEYGLGRLFKRNEDCLYAGYGYRCLIKDKRKVNCDNLNDLASSVLINKQYQSFSSVTIDINNIAKYTDFIERINKYSIVFVVKTSIIGLDVWKYIKKHRLEQNEIIKSYPQQESLHEIIARFENSFTVEYINDNLYIRKW